MNVWKEIEQNRRFDEIDICKLIMSYVVIAIHTNPIVGMQNVLVVQLVILIEDFAVPFFFITSGFFLYDSKEERMKNYLVKLVRIYCVWTLISLPLSVYGYYVSNDGFLHNILSYIKYFFFVGKLYNSYHLWYVLAMIYAVAGIWFLQKKKVSLNGITVVAFLFFVFSQGILWLNKQENISNEMLGLFVKLYEFVFNKGGIFTGMIYVCIGMHIARSKKYLNKWYCLAGLLLINIVQFVFRDVIAFKYIWLCLFDLLEAMLFFEFILNIRLPRCRYAIQYRKASTIIYLSHLLWYSLYTIILIKEPNRLGLISFIFTCVVSSINALGLMKLSENKKWQWIRKII